VHPAAALMKEAMCHGCGKYGHESVCGECYIHVLDVTISYELQRVMAGEEGAIEALEEVTVLERELRARRSWITGLVEARPLHGVEVVIDEEMAITR
jgi:hypothetical protein